MARPLRIEFSGAVYHVIARGNARQAVFLDEADSRRFLRTLWRVAERVEWDVWAYCLMPNHYHLLLHTRRPTLSCGMRDLNGPYSMTFNRRHRRVGHVFQGRYRSILVDHTAYLLDVVRYIVLNPVHAGLCASPDAWKWSSYRATVGQAIKPRKLVTRTILAHFAPTGGDGVVTFADFVRHGHDWPDPGVGQRIPTIVGGQSFVASVLAERPVQSSEVPRAERAQIPLAEFAARAERNTAIRAAYNSGWYSQTQIAKHFGLHYTTVSRIIDTLSCHHAKSKDLTP